MALRKVGIIDLRIQGVKQIQSGGTAIQSSMVKSSLSVDRLKGAFGRLKSSVFSLKSLFTGFAITMGVNLVKSTLDFAASFSDVEAGFKAFAAGAGLDAANLMARIREETKGAIPSFNIMVGLNKLLTNVVGATTEEFAELAKISAILAKTTGQDVTETFNKVADAIVSGRTQAVKMLGIPVDLGMEFRQFAKANNLAADAVTGQVKSLITLQAVLREGRKQIEGVDEVTVDFGVRLARIEELFNKLKVAVGEALINAGIEDAFLGIAKSAVAFASTLPSIIQNLGTMLQLFGALKGAQAGFQIGGIFGPVGSAIGGAIGGAAGFFGSGAAISAITSTTDADALKAIEKIQTENRNAAFSDAL